MKTKQHTSTIGATVSAAYSDLQELGEECREVCDNMPENFHSGNRYESLESAANLLESLDEPEVPEDIEDHVISYTELLPSSKGRSLSRAGRRDNAVSMLNEVIASLNEEFDTNEKAMELMEILEGLVSEAEGLEFPGMRG